jgi:hypothetical protein
MREEIDPDEAETLSQAERLQYFDELSERIDSEVVDLAWQRATEGPLGRLLAEQLGSNVRVAEATCASSHCRVKLSHPEWARMPPGLMFAFDVARASLQVTEVQYDNRDEGATTLYFKRGSAPAARAALADPVPPDAVVANSALANTAPANGALTDTE